MLLDERDPIRDLDPALWETLRRCRFVPKFFAPYPSVRSIGPQAWDGEDDTRGYHVSSPLRGQEFDAAAFEIVDGGWDHEHCDVCNARIEDGDFYWTNDGPAHVDLCERCFERIKTELRT